MVAMLTRRDALAGIAASAWTAARDSAAQTPAPSETWSFNVLDHVGAHRTTVEGHPRVIGNAIAFNGVDDAIFLDVHPLAGATAFTWEVIFRPDGDGAPEQRFFHLQENGTDNRMLFETRIISGEKGNRWCLDSYVKSGEASAALLDKTKLHSVDEWHHAAAVCDGKELRNYVDGVQQGVAPIDFKPHLPGRTSLGVRINRVNYFKGQIRQARMTRQVLSPQQFLKK